MTMMWQGQTGVLATSIRATLDTVQRLEPLVDSAADDAPGGSVVHTGAYPAGPLREVLANTAALIRADVGTKVVTVDYGDWDMHTGLGEGDRDPSKGWMAEHAGHLAASLKAFFADLGTAAGRVTLVTISEFGRRVEENGDHGVDHGYGNVMLLLGAGVKGGQVHGAWPGISRAKLNEGDLQVTTDYRTRAVGGHVVPLPRGVREEGHDLPRAGAPPSASWPDAYLPALRLVGPACADPSCSC